MNFSCFYYRYLTVDQEIIFRSYLGDPCELNIYRHVRKTTKRIYFVFLARHSPERFNYHSTGKFFLVLFPSTNAPLLIHLALTRSKSRMWYNIVSSGFRFTGQLTNITRNERVSSAVVTTLSPKSYVMRL